MSNKKDLAFGAGLWMFGQFVDRYATDAYGPPVGVLEAIDRAGQVGDLVALDINYPFDSGVSVDQVRAALERNKLRCHAITPASYTRKFQKGALTNPDPKLRRESIELYKNAIPVARDLGAKFPSLSLNVIGCRSDGSARDARENVLGWRLAPGRHG